MSCDPTINYFYLTGADFWGFVPAGTPVSCRVQLTNAGKSPGSITVHFDAAPALTTVSEDMWYPVAVRVFGPIGAGAVLPFDQDLDLPPEDAQIRAVAIGDPAGAPLVEAAQTLSLMVV